MTFQFLPTGLSPSPSSCFVTKTPKSAGCMQTLNGCNGSVVKSSCFRYITTQHALRIADTVTTLTQRSALRYSKACANQADTSESSGNGDSPFVPCPEVKTLQTLRYTDVSELSRNTNLLFLGSITSSVTLKCGSFLTQHIKDTSP